MEPGSYSKMFIYVDEVTGELVDNPGEVITVKLPATNSIYPYPLK